MGATKIEDLAGELKNSTFFSVAPPSLILCANDIVIPPHPTSGHVPREASDCERIRSLRGYKTKNYY